MISRMIEGTGSLLVVVTGPGLIRRSTRSPGSTSQAGSGRAL
jgi:hypothetical protein